MLVVYTEIHIFGIWCFHASLPGYMVHNVVLIRQSHAFAR